MRKYLSIIFIIALAAVLVSCNKGGKLDDFAITHQEFNGNIYAFTVNTKETVETNDDLLEIGYTAAGQIYDQLAKEIGLNKRILKLTISVDSQDKLLLTFSINNNVNEPGLKLIDTNFK